MHVLLLNGSPNADGCTFTALSEIAATLKAENITSEIFQLGKSPCAAASRADLAGNAAHVHSRTTFCPRSSKP